ncbi:MAG: AraC family transcriptional regulator [Eggerthellaceae bacterium]|nr:AraC family transcriptional regulator [Eggerthellaceae bacterium]
MYRAFRSRAWTVANYIQRVRLEHVHAELAFVSPRIPINSIALGSGFECLRHFHRQFKKLYGRTPGACRRELYGTSRSSARESYDPSSGSDAGVCNGASFGSNDVIVLPAAKTLQREPDLAGVSVETRCL